MVEVGGGVGVKTKSRDIGGGRRDDGANLHLSRFLAHGITGFGHIDFTFVPKGNLIGFDPGGDEAGGHGVGHLTSCPRAWIAAGGDFNGYGISRVDSQIFPSVGGGGFAGQGGQQGGHRGFDTIRFGVKIGQ